MERDEREVLYPKRRFLEIRCRVLQLIRAFFESEGFLEVQTPLLTAAPAPEVHIRPIPAGSGRFLSTSPELHMKRLLAAGFEKIFQVTRAFRGGERGRLHHPEFTILEWYRSGANYKDLQQDCQKLVAIHLQGDCAGVPAFISGGPVSISRAGGSVTRSGRRSENLPDGTPAPTPTRTASTWTWCKKSRQTWVFRPLHT